MRERVILHSDLNNFYASVEMLRHPSLRDKPLVVGGDASLRHGIVLAKNNLAKASGVVTGEALWQARQKCPGLQVILPDLPEYLRFAQAVRAIYRRYTDRIEPFGMDEAWLDVTGSQALFGTGQQIADRIRSEVKTELGLTVSIGVANNKIFAKLGSDMKKPDATTVLRPEEYEKTVFRLPASDLLFVGRATKRKLMNIGLLTIGDVARVEPKVLSDMLGKCGEMLHIYANGLDDSPVARMGEYDPIKSIGNSTTTPRDLCTLEEIKLTFQALADSVAARLRETGFRARTVQICIRDKELNWMERQCKLSAPSCLASELTQAAMELFTKHYLWERPVRTLGVRGTDLVCAGDAIQLDLFDMQARRLKQEELDRAVDGVRKRFGYFSVQRAALLKNRVLGVLDGANDHNVYAAGYAQTVKEVKNVGLSG